MQCNDKDILVAALKFGDSNNSRTIRSIEDRVGISQTDRLPYDQASAIDAAYSDKKIDDAEFKRITSGSKSTRLSCILTHLQKPSSSHERVLIKALEQDYTLVQADALESLVNLFGTLSKDKESALIDTILKDRLVLRELVKQMRSSTSARTRANAAKVLSSVVKPLMTNNDIQPNIKLEWGLKIFPAAIYAMQNDKEPKVRARAKQIMSTAKSVLQKLVNEMLYSTSTTTRIDAAKALRWAVMPVGSRSFIPPQIGQQWESVKLSAATRAVQYDQDPTVRVEAIEILSTGRDSKAVQRTLIKALLNKKQHPKVRAAAANALGPEYTCDWLGGQVPRVAPSPLADPKEAEEALIKALKQEQDALVRIAVVQSLVRDVPSTAVDKALIETMLNDSDPRVRHAAAREIDSGIKCINLDPVLANPKAAKKALDEALKKEKDGAVIGVVKGALKSF